ncbi:hypothetical protein M501DRAFT_602243 [Patellaria atrata CBS 101060]|uniref:Uncharacterized protein n=1 Tax=Patellaria atrata CBS 101060 TaxID=1346257 RepID=A0A9P4S185_9PEZI|nr:hypothetical protein M501DRAFT_602243 [Patellaria atrata CBS 101060]
MLDGLGLGPAVDVCKTSYLYPCLKIRSDGYCIKFLLFVYLERFDIVMTKKEERWKRLRERSHNRVRYLDDDTKQPKRFFVNYLWGLLCTCTFPYPELDCPRQKTEDSTMIKRTLDQETGRGKLSLAEYSEYGAARISLCCTVQWIEPAISGRQ